MARGKSATVCGSIHDCYPSGAEGLVSPMKFVGMAFVKCSSCGRDVRVWESKIWPRLPQRARLTDDAAVAFDDGSFECPFCRSVQRPSAE
jgi:hypothetical protein